MPDYKKNTYQKNIELKDKLEESILLSLLPEKELNRPDYTIATISRIMSSYIRTLRHVTKREWKFEVLNIYESFFPLFIDFYECVVSNELGIKRENVIWDTLYKVQVSTSKINFLFELCGDEIKIRDSDIYDGPRMNTIYFESNFMNMIRRLSYYFQSPNTLPVELLEELEYSINLDSIFQQWMSASDNHSLIPQRDINIDGRGYKIVNNLPPTDNMIAPPPLKERLRMATVPLPNIIS